MPDTHVQIVVGDEPATIGDLDSDGYRIDLPAGSFETETVLLVPIERDLPEADHDFELLGAGVELGIDRELPRADGNLTVTLRIDTDGVTDPGSVFVGYHHPSRGWTLLAPDEIDLDAGHVVFTTNHFSQFVGVTANQDRQLTEFINRRVAEDYVRAEVIDSTEDQIAQMVGAILTDGLEVRDTSIIEIVTRNVLNEVPGGSMAVALWDMDQSALAAEVQSRAVTHLLQALSNNRTVVQLGEMAGGVGSALGAAAGQDYATAARHLGEEIASNLPLASTVINIGRTIGEVTDHVIGDLWMSPALQKAYEAYRDGASQGYFGYRVEAGDWNELTRQMGSVARQYRIDHIRSHCAIYGCDPDALTAAERQRIGDEGMAKLKERFDARVQREPIITEQREIHAELFQRMIERNLFDESPINPMWAPGASFELLMRRATMMVDRVKLRTGRPDMVSVATWESSGPDGRFSTQHIVELLRVWYESPDTSREEAFEQRLIEMGLLEADEPTIDLTGRWIGTFDLAFTIREWNATVTNSTGQVILEIQATPGADGTGRGTVTAWYNVEQSDDADIIFDWEPGPYTGQISWVDDQVTISTGHQFTGTISFELDGQMRMSGEWSWDWGGGWGHLVTPVTGRWAAMPAE